MNRPNTLAGAALLGIVGIVLVFVLGEGVHVSTSLPGAVLWQVLVFVAPLAGYYGVAAYFMTRGRHRSRDDWAISLALVAPILLSTLVAVVVERDKRSALAPAVITIVGVFSSWLGARVARTRDSASSSTSR
jgi:uncharacterized membrane protein (UPF0136 family)